MGIIMTPFRYGSAAPVVTGAPQLVASSYAWQNNTLPSSCSTAYPTSVPFYANDVAILYIAAHGFGATTIGTPTGWTQIEQDQANLTNQAHAVFWKRLTGAETGSVSTPITAGTVTTPGAGWTGVMTIWRGCVTSGNPFEDSGHNESASNTATGSCGVKSRLLSGPDRTVVHCYMGVDNNTETITPGSGFTVAQNATGSPHLGCVTYRQFTAPGYAGEEALLSDDTRWGSIYLSLVPQTTVSSSTPVLTDPSFASVVFLAGLETAASNPTAAFEIINPDRGLVKVGGTAYLDYAQTKFGSGSIYCGTGCFSATDSADWAFGSSPFTIEGWVRFNTAPTTGFHYLVAQYDTGTNQRSWSLRVNAGALELGLSADGTTQTIKASAAWAPSTLTWYHVAADWDGTNYRTYVDGVMKGKSSTGVTLFDSSAAMTVGAALTSGATNSAFTGRLDEVRITKGVARYASDSGYTVPTAAFPRG